MVRVFGDDLLRVIAEVGMVFHPTVSPTAPELEAQMTLKLVSPVSLAVLA